MSSGTDQWGVSPIGEATLCFVINRDDILLIKKKQGVGRGYYNAPGGKVKHDESPRESAIREVKEETGLVISEVSKRGELAFRIDGEPFSHVHIYRTSKFCGVTTESAEASPKWFSIDRIPYESMWPGDRLWIPELLDDHLFIGFIDLDRTERDVVDHYIKRIPSFSG